MNTFLALYYAGTIGINVLSAGIVLVASKRQVQTHFKTIFLLCMSAIGYQYSSWAYHESSSIPDAVYWIKVQLAVALASMPLYFLLFAQLSKFKQRLYWSVFFGTFAMVLIVANLLAPHSLRFEELPTFVTYTTVGGHEINRLVGVKSNWMYPYYAIGISMLCFMTYIVKRLFALGNKPIAWLLIFIIIAQMLTTIVAIRIDNGLLNTFYLGGLPFTILNIAACLHISFSLYETSKTLDDELLKNNQLEDAITQIATNVSSTENYNFYIDISKKIKNISNGDLVFFGTTCNTKKGLKVSTKVVYYKDATASNFSYYVDDLPVDISSHKKISIIENNLTDICPDIEYFDKIQGKALISVPLFNTNKELEGVLVIIYQNPIKPSKSLLKILNIFSNRAAAEISRDKLEVELKEAAMQDLKTKLPNLAKIRQIIDLQQTSHVNPSQETHIILLFNIDRFGLINRQFGFQSAERLIIEIALRLKQYQTHGTVVGRTGGDAFCVIIRNTDKSIDDVINTHWKNIRGIVNRPYNVNGNDITVSISGGASYFPMVDMPDSHSYDMDPIRCAEHALAHSKQTGRNKLTIFDKQVLLKISRTQELESALGNALQDQKELFVVYQPKVDSTGNIVGAEALSRWISPEFGFVPPDEFIQVAETYGLIDRLGNWCISVVCEQISQWKQAGAKMPGRVSINVSANQFQTPGFLNNTIEILSRYNVSPSEIDIELTESSFMKDRESTIDTLKALREYGFTISLDDFGTGYSSLSYLQNLPLDCLKIDRTFVNDITKDNDSALVESIVAIGKHMSLSIIAEGVENQEQVNKLNQYGCRVFQGFYFSRPISANDIKNKYLIKTFSVRRSMPKDKKRADKPSLP